MVLGRLGELWKGLLPDYGWSGASGAWTAVAYIVSAILGVAILSAIAWAVVSARRRRHPAVPPDHPSAPESARG